ncbi:MAG: hypothetical protein ACD_11C00146G0006 [uncultured bacterium]|nr:MAG: hypothetical protein ACD_11C00146G0006 [uncultured bacterium]HBR71189.1 hypothetical protein [Candidatus Moranbacteria bacterium]
MTDKIKRIFNKAKSVIFFDPLALFKEEKHLLDKPFYFEGLSAEEAGGNGEAVLLIHGWSTTPYEIRRLGTFLNENGYTVSGPMLSGHGTVPRDLEEMRWTTWFDDVEKAYLELKKKHSRVYVAGTSIGASLAVLLAEKYSDVSGLILMATPYELRMEKTVEFFVKIFSKFFKYRKKFYPPTFGKSTAITRLISYQTYPLSSVLEAAEVVRAARKNLEKIVQPCLLLQSSSDHIVSRGSMENIYERINSKKKNKKYIKRAYHTFISDIKNEHVFEDILKFLQEN